MRGSLSSIAGRIVLVAALLLAQHSALAHLIWHAAAGHAQDAEASASPEPSVVISAEEELCGFHTSLGTVLGAVGSASAPCPIAEVPQYQSFPVAASAFAAQAALPHSTGPPVFLPL